MLIPFSELMRNFDLHVNGVVHVGAHEAQEHDDYRSAFGEIPILWIEADPKVYEKLLEAVCPWPMQKNFFSNSLVSDVSDESINFHIANNEQSSSMFELGTHEQVHPEVFYVDELVLETSTLDKIVGEFPISFANFLNMDVQGAEAKVLAGGHGFLERVDYVYTEVNRDELYKGGVKLPELDAQLNDLGFTRVQTFMHENLGWGDAFYIRK